MDEAWARIKRSQEQGQPVERIDDKSAQDLGVVQSSETKSEQPQVKEEQSSLSKSVDTLKQTVEALARTVPPAIPQPPRIEPLQAPKTEEFDQSPVVEEQGLGIMIYGDKGTGKTTLAFTADGTIACLSFDQQSNIIKKEMFANDSRITIFDAVRYYSQIDQDAILVSSTLTYTYILHLLSHAIKDIHPDWIVIDGLEKMKELAEYKMRGANNLRPFENFANWGYWHERTFYMDQIDREAKRVAKKGVIYTSYIYFRRVVNDQGEKITEEPKWAGNTKEKTRIVIKVERSTTTNGQEFYATVENSKENSVPTSGKKVVGTVDAQGKPTVLGFKVLKR